MVDLNRIPFQRGDLVYKPVRGVLWIGVVVGMYIKYKFVHDETTDENDEDEVHYIVQVEYGNTFISKWDELKPYKEPITLISSKT